MPAPSVVGWALAQDRGQESRAHEGHLRACGLCPDSPGPCLSPPPLHSGWVTHLQSLMPPRLSSVEATLEGRNPSESTSRLPSGREGPSRRELRTQREHPRPGQLQSAVTAGQQEAPGRGVTPGVIPHPRVSVRVALYLLLPPGSLLASVTRSGNIRSREVT